MDKLTVEQELAMLREENARLKAESQESATIRISDKGCISVYGLGSRFPVTLYRKQWQKLFTMIYQVKGFIDGHASELDAVDARFQAEKQAKKQVA